MVRRDLPVRLGANALAMALAAGAVAQPAIAAETDEAVSSEIVVTAQRRSEGIEKVPIPVAAFSEKTLGNLKIESTDDLQFAMPGITNSQTAGDGGQLRAARQEAHAIVNLTGGFVTPSENLELGWFVENLTDKKLNSLVSTDDTGVYYTPDETRTYGVTLRYSF